VSGPRVEVAATAQDNVRVSSVDFYVDGLLVQTDDQAPYGWIWDTTAIPPGAHALKATARDAAGNAASATIDVDVDIMDLGRGDGGADAGRTGSAEADGGGAEGRTCTAPGMCPAQCVSDTDCAASNHGPDAHGPAGTSEPDVGSGNGGSCAVTRTHDEGGARLSMLGAVFLAFAVRRRIARRSRRARRGRSVEPFVRRVEQ
jgi:hypothetical protein